jgi:hypothetical protein
MRLRIGNIIRFTYSHKVKDTNTGEPYKEVLVLNPRWDNKLHAIDLKRLSPAEREVLQAVLAPRDAKPHRLPLVNDIRSKMNPRDLIRNPKMFYTQFVKLFLRNKDAYRQYNPTLMTGVTRVEHIGIDGKPQNPNQSPLFGEPQQTPTALDRLKTTPTPAAQASMSPAAQRLAALRAKVAGKSAPAPRMNPGVTPLPPGAAQGGVMQHSNAAARLAALRGKIKGGK